MKKDIRHQVSFPHPPEVVWEYLTRPELLELWLMKNTFTPVVGAEFQFRTNPMPSLDFDGICHCKVLEIVPFRKLSYSWKNGPGNGEITLDSVVTWQLQPTATGTDLLLEHTGFSKESEGFYNGFSQGWPEKFGNIDRLLKEGRHGNTTA